MKPWFRLELRDEVARKMTRTQYYQARRWLRYMAREVAKQLALKAAS